MPCVAPVRCRVQVIAAISTPEGVLLGSSGETAEIVPEAAEHIFVTPA